MFETAWEIDVEFLRLLNVVLIRHTDLVAVGVLVECATSVRDVVLDVQGDQFGEGIVVRSGRLRGLDGQVQHATGPEPRRIGRGKRVAGFGGDQDGCAQGVVRAWRLREVGNSSGICEADDLQLFADIRIAR